MFPDNTKYFIEAFNDAVSTLYVLIQNKSKTPDYLRLRTNLLSDQPLVNITKKGRKKKKKEMKGWKRALLDLIYKASPCVRRIIIGNANIDFINALCAIQQQPLDQ